MAQLPVWKMVSVGGAAPEPARIIVHGGETLAFTCGCSDPFYLDREGCICKIVEDVELAPSPKAKARARRQPKAAPPKSHNWMPHN